MNWVIDGWRLKLVAVGLSVVMLGAVAFSQNPPTFKTLTVTPIQYTIPPNLVVINPPIKTTVRVTGLADTIQAITPSSLVARFDLSKVSPGPAVKVNLVVTSLVAGVTVQNPSVPVALNIDQRKSQVLTVQVRYPHVTEGWVVTKAEARCPNSPCAINFSGPASWQTGLKAFVDFTAPVEWDSRDALNLLVTLEQNGAPVDMSTFSKTVPGSSLDVTTVAVHIEAKTGSTSKQVVLIDSPPSQPPPSGYRVTAITIDPISVVISGKADILSKIQNLVLPALDLSGHTSDFTFKVTIPYPPGVTGPIPVVRVTYSISPNPNIHPTPSP
ncbi:MAG: CdaR family protein [Candidatus Dormibacteraeota bacterium]|nr:CdaR family protein [Candidatus Dormibacteraeota bacterium]